MTCTSVNAPFLEKKFKKSFLIPCRVRCRGSVNQSCMKGFWAENNLGKGLGNSELSFFFFLHFPCRYANCSAIKMQRNTFSFFFFFLFIKKKSSTLHCLSFQPKHVGQCYREAMEALQPEKRKEKLSYLQRKHLVLTSAWRSALAEWKPGQIHSALLSPTVVSSPTMCLFSARQDTQTFHLADTKMNTSDSCSSWKTRQHKDFHFTACP